MARSPIPAQCFALTVVRRGDRFLLVQERKYEQTWYLPAGRVDPGETFGEAARRETLEEAGIPVRLDGVLRVEHSPLPDGIRLRVFFLAHPEDDRPPKRNADYESLGAAWVALDELDRFPLRGAEVRALLRYVAGGGPVFPLGLLTAEGAPWALPG